MKKQQRKRGDKTGDKSRPLIFRGEKKKKTAGRKKTELGKIYTISWGRGKTTNIQKGGETVTANSAGGSGEKKRRGSGRPIALPAGPNERRQARSAPRSMGHN